MSPILLIGRLFCRHGIVGTVRTAPNSLLLLERSPPVSFKRSLDRGLQALKVGGRRCHPAH